MIKELQEEMKEKQWVNYNSEQIIDKIVADTAKRVAERIKDAPINKAIQKRQAAVSYTMTECEDIYEKECDKIISETEAV